MKKSQCYYLAFLNYEDGEMKRSVSPAADMKAKYVANTLIRVAKAKIISIASIKNKEKTKFYKAKKISLEDSSCVYGPTVSSSFHLLRGFGKAITSIWLLNYLILHLRKRDILVVYHSLRYMQLVNIAHKLKKFRLVLETEEIYSDVTGDIKTRQKEIQYLQSAEGYLFATELLNSVVNVHRKPAICIYGTYHAEPERKCKIFNNKLQMQNTKTIHCVYAGTFDPRKGGSAAAAAAEFLPANYHIHILGFGSETDTKKMKELISKLSKTAAAIVTYDGLLLGEDYIRFIQSCDIGLSTQNPTAAFNDTSFPSKILSYMANGLRVVSIRIPAIEHSTIGKYMYYYDCQNPMEIAMAIQSVDMNNHYDGRQIISELDFKFETDLAGLLAQIESK